MSKLAIVVACLLAVSATARADWVTLAVNVGTQPRSEAVNPVTNKIYVANYGGSSVTVIDGATNDTTTLAAGTTPQAVAVNPVTNKIYVANHGSANVTVIDGATNGTTTVAVGIGPGAVGVNPITNLIYVANDVSNNVTVIDGATNDTTTVVTGTRPYAVAVNPVTNKIYVPNNGSANVTVIDGATNGTTTVPAGTDPYDVAVNPVTNKIYVANWTSDTVTVIDGATNGTTPVTAGTSPAAVAVNPVTNRIYVANANSGNVTVIDGATNGTTTVAAGTSPIAVAANPVTNRIYVANRYSNDVTVIDGATGSTTTLVAGSYTVRVAVNPVTNKIYAANYSSNSVTVIDGATDSTQTVTVGTNPSAVAVNPVTNKVYVANRGSNTVTVIDGATNDTTTVTAGSVPRAVAVNPVTNKVYVANAGGTVTVIDGATNDTQTVTAGSGPVAVAVNPVTNKVYVANYSGNTVTVIDGATNATQTVTAGSAPVAVAVNPATNKVYVANQGSDTVTMIDGATNAAQSVTVGSAPGAVAVNPATNRVYVANYGSNSVSVIDGASNTVIATPAVGATPQAVAVNPMTNRVYVANYSNSVSVIDGASNTVIATPAVGMNPVAVAVNPVTNKVYAANGYSSTVTVIDGATNDTQTVTVASICCAVAVNPVTNKTYVIDNNVTVISDAPVNDTRVRAVMNQLPGDTTSRARPTLSGKGVNRSAPGRSRMLAVGNRLNTAQQAWNKVGILSGAGTDSLTWLFNWGSDSLILGENFIVLQPLESDAGTTNNQGLGTPFAGNLEVYPIYRIGTAAPETSFTPEPPIPLGPKHKTMKAGGCIAADDQGTGNLYVLKGNSTCEFYRYDPARDTWYSSDSIPATDPDGRKRTVKKGASMAVAGGKVYVRKGGNSRVLWRYDPGVCANTGAWVPGSLGDFWAWTSQVSATVAGTNYLYTLGYDKTLRTTLFWRLATSNGTAEGLPAPTPPPGGKALKTGACIVYYPDDEVVDGVRRIFALQWKTNDFYAYNVGGDWAWVNAMSTPWPGSNGSAKKVGAGAGMAYVETSRPTGGHIQTAYALKGGNTQELWAYTVTGGWTAFDTVPRPQSGKKVKAGGGIAYNQALNRLMVSKGNGEIYRIAPQAAAWKDPALTLGASLQSAGSNPEPAFGLSVVPNPLTSSVNPSICYSLPTPGNVSLKLYDVTGQLVATLAKGYTLAGSHTAHLNANKLVRGVYLLKYESEGNTTTSKLIIE